MRISPRSPRRQRRALYTAPPSERRRRMGVILSRELRKRFRVKSVPARKGDTVRVLSGSYAGREERIARVNHRDYSLTLDNITLKTVEEKLKPLPLRPSHLVLVRLNLSDPWRRRSLKVREEELTAEERGETPEEPADGTPPPAAEATEPAAEAPAEPAPEPSPEATPPPKRTRAKPAPREDA